MTPTGKRDRAPDSVRGKVARRLNAKCKKAQAFLRLGVSGQ
jgi:hypothetical protein